MKFHDQVRSGLSVFRPAQFIRIMRLTIIIITSCFLQLSASSRAQKISLNEKNASLESVINKIRHQTGYYFIGNTRLIRKANPVNINVKNASLTEVLAICFSNQAIDYTIVNNTVVIKKKSVNKEQPVFWQQIIIKGKVTDESGIGLPGASITELATGKVTSTDTAGNFSVAVANQQAVLLVSYIGYETTRIQVQNQTYLAVQLKPAQRGLDEVVVVGYGTQKRASILGSVATVSGNDIADIPASNLSNALAGRLAGVTITQGSGKPGANSAIKVRAVGTLSGLTEPLYVIDGIVTDQFTFDGLDVSEVESVTVLKDAASAAVYGARSANGVVLVTTRRGKSGQKPVISYAVTAGIDKAINIPKTQTAAEQALFLNNYYQLMQIPASDNRYYTQDELDYFKANNHSWIDEGWHDPTLIRHALNVSGGSDKIRYFMGGSFYKGTGSLDNLSYKKTNLRVNVDAEVAKGLTASVNLNTNMRNDLKPYWRYDYDQDNMPDLYKALLLRTGMVPPFINGKPVGNYVEWHPLEITKSTSGYNRKKFQEYNAILSLDYKIPFVEGLSVKAVYNKYSRHTFTKQFSLPYLLYNFKTTGGNNHLLTDQIVSTKLRDDGEFLKEMYVNDESYQLNGYVNYNRNFGKHGLNAVFVYEQAEGTQDWFSAQRKYFISPAIDQLFGGSSDNKNQSADGSASENGRISYVGRASYNYDEKYLLEGSFRYDGSQRFAPDKRWGFFPSVSAGWRISKEPFFKVGFINDLKIRASVGLLGNDAIASWQWYQAYAIPGIPYSIDNTTINTTGGVFGTVTNGIAPGSIANPAITWEKSLTYNAGFDAQLLNNKMSMSFDVFKRHTYDIFGSRQETAPATFGAVFPSQNYGVMDSYGFEVELGYANTLTNGLKYYVRGNLGYATNKIITWDQAANIRDYQSLIGQPNDRIMGYEVTGIIRTQAELDALPAGYTVFGKVPQLGMLKFRDIRGLTTDQPDQKIDVNDQTVLAKHATPPVNYGFSIGGSWKGFSLDLVFQGLAGNSVLIGKRDVYGAPQEKEFAFWNDSWSPQNPNASLPRPASGGYNEASSIWLKNASFLRCKNLTLSYDFSQRLLSKTGIKKAKLFFTGTNLFLLEDHVKWMDPEATGITSYPIMKSYSLGLNISI
jgi:TonB-linked SusC/RagA family outer membrane protein